MELKHIQENFKPLLARLLIVPYGIETCTFGHSRGSTFLLIVPYGIETKQKSCVPPER